MFAALLAHRDEVFLSASGCLLRYDATRLLYVPTSTVFSYCTGIYNNCRFVKERVEMINRTENVLMTMVCFFAACWNRNSSHLFGNVLFDHHHCDILVSLMTAILEDVEILGLDEVI